MRKIDVLREVCLHDDVLGHRASMGGEGCAFISNSEHNACNVHVTQDDYEFMRNSAFLMRACFH